MEDRILATALTFDDVLLVPQRSSVVPSQVELRTQLSRRVPLNIPIVSAAMDTVTESEMAIGLARLGGIGVIHKNLAPADQAREVTLVKRSVNGVINDPVTLTPDAPIARARELMEIHKISGIPIVEPGGDAEHPRVAGILTSRDLKFVEDGNEVQEVMTRDDLVTASPDTDLAKARTILHQAKVEKLLLVDDEGRLHGLITIRDLDNLMRFPDANLDPKGRLFVAAAVGVNDDDRVALLAGAHVDVLVVDTAHGHSENVIHAVQRYKAAHANVDVIADGGIRFSGDAVKALAAGASSVMLGGLLAGTDESPGELIYHQGRTFKTVRGMGSIGAMMQGSGDRYQQGDVKQRDKFVPEGVEGRVPYKGALAGFAFQLVGGIRSGMGYSGCQRIPELWSKARFVRITAAGVLESHPHDISITREAPNYLVPQF